MVLRYTSSSDGLERPREPVFNGFPAIVLILSAAIIGVSAIGFLAGDEVLNWLYYAFALIHDPQINYIGRPFGAIGPVFLHVFLHGGLFHLIMNMTVMVAFGPAIAKAMGPGMKGAVGFLLFFFLCAAAGALFQLGWSWIVSEKITAIGASSALSGFFAAGGWLMGGLRGAVRLSAPWLVINVVIAVIGNAITQSLFGMQLAWAAHIGGLAGGFVLFPFIVALFNPRLRLR